MPRWSRLPVALASAALVAGCTAAPSPPAVEPSPLAVAWTEVALPTGGQPGRTVRDLARCGDRWYAVGAVRGAPDATGHAPNRPAAWQSRDGRVWRLVPLHPVSFYGAQSVIYALACRGAEVAALGAASGGVHGNPRTSTWRSRPDGSWLEDEPEFQTFGGPDAVNVARAAAAGSGFLLAGNWLNAAGAASPAVWTSTDRAHWRRVAVTARQSSTEAGPMRASDVAPGPDGGWVLVGESTGPGGRAEPAAWFSPDGVRWSAAAVPGAVNGGGTLVRVAPHQGGLVAIGVDGRAFGAWWAPDGRQFEPVHDFGDPYSGSRAWSVSGVASATTPAGPVVLAAVGNGAECELWAGAATGGRWRRLWLPTRLTAGPDAGLRVAASGGRTVLATDDGATTRLWITDLPGVSPA